MRRIRISYLVGRDAKTGHFLPIAVARKRKATATVEMVSYWLKR